MVFGRQRRPNGSDESGQALSPFDSFMTPFGSGFGDSWLSRSFFGRDDGFFGSMRPFMDHQHSMHAFTDPDRFADFCAPEAPQGTRGQYHSQVMVMSSTTGPDGKPRTTRYMQSTSGDADRQLRQVHQAYSDSATGLDRMALERHVADQGRRVVREVNRRTGEENRTDNYRGLDESQRDNFDALWAQQTRSAIGDAYSPLSRDHRRPHPHHQQISDRN